MREIEAGYPPLITGSKKGPYFNIYTTPSLGEQTRRGARAVSLPCLPQSHRDSVCWESTAARHQSLHHETARDSNLSSDKVAGKVMMLLHV